MITPHGLCQSGIYRNHAWHFSRILLLRMYFCFYRCYYCNICVTWSAGGRHLWAIKIFLSKRWRQLLAEITFSSIFQQCDHDPLWNCWCTLFHCHVQQLLSHLLQAFASSPACSVIYLVGLSQTVLNNFFYLTEFQLRPPVSICPRHWLSLNPCPKLITEISQIQIRQRISPWERMKQMNKKISSISTQIVATKTW